MEGFVMLCKAYMGIVPHFDLWNYFFRARLQQGLDGEASVMGSADIFVHYGPGINRYFCFLMSNPPVEWQKIWFFLKNDADVLILVLTSSHPIPQPKWGYGVARGCIRWLQPLHDVVVQRLLRGRLTGTDLPRTFISHRVQPLHQREMTKWMYPGLSCPDCSFSVELYDTEINTRIRGVLAHGADMNFDFRPVPLREGLDSPCVSLHELTFVYLCQFLFFQCIHVLM
jgi:hypothetical protein